VTISERIAAARRERRVLARVSRAAWRLDQAEPWVPQLNASLVMRI